MNAFVPITTKPELVKLNFLAITMSKYFTSN